MRVSIIVLADPVASLPTIGCALRTVWLPPFPQHTFQGAIQLRSAASHGSVPSI